MKKNDIFCSENEIMNNIDSKYKNSEEYIYKNIFLCPLNKNDCINSMDIFDDLLIYGTIMGNVYLCRVDKNNLRPKIMDNENNDKNLNINVLNKNETKNDINKNVQKDEQKIIKNKDNFKNKMPKIPNIKLKRLEQNNNNKENNITPNNNINTYGNSDIIKENNNEEKEINLKINSKLNDSIKAVKEISIIRKNTKENYSPHKNEDLISLKKNIINNTEDIILYPQITNIITNACENISCVAFETRDNVIISVGDLEIIKLDKISTFNINDKNSQFDYTRIRNYSSEEEHIINCENTTCFLTSNNFLMINTLFEENDSPITMQQIPYQNKIIENLDIIKGNIEMFTFCVPFDFDGDKFLFLDYQTKLIRRICIYYTISKNKPFIYKINSDFGHISHMKLVYNNRILLCRKNIICEIYKINDNFTLLEEWRHIGEEIIAVEIYVNGTKMSNNNINNIKNDNCDMDKAQSTRRIFENEENKEKIKEIKIKFNNNSHSHKKNSLYIDINKSNNSSFRELQYNNKWNYKKQFKEESNINDNSNNYKNINKNNDEEIEIYNRYKSKSKNKDNNINFRFDNDIQYKNKDNYLKIKTNTYKINNTINLKKNVCDDDEDKLFIATLDQNGNFNLYKNKKNSVIFNLYNISNIEQKYKDEEFFSTGYPYFIIMNSKYFGISTDHGIFVITKCKK